MIREIIEKITWRLLDKQPNIQEKILEHYLDKKVVQVSINELQDFRDGEQIKFDNVVLYNSIITTSKIVADDGIIAIGSHNVLSQNYIEVKKREEAE